jgi:hypothetical protein
MCWNVLVLQQVHDTPWQQPHPFRDTRLWLTCFLGVCLQLPAEVAGFPDTHLSSKVRRTAVADYLTRQLAAAANTVSAQSQNAAAGWHGAKGGDVQVDMPGEISNQVRSMHAVALGLH